MTAQTGVADSLTGSAHRDSALRIPPSAHLQPQAFAAVDIDAEAQHLPTERSNRGMWRILIMNPLKIFESQESQIKDDRYDHFIFEKLEAHPRGYPRLAALIDSDVDYVMFRKFGRLRVRSLLYKQAELTDLEDELEELDKADSEEPTSKWKLSSHINLPNADNGTRKALMGKIDSKMKEYDELLLRDSQIRNLRKPSRRLHKSVFNYIYNEKPVTAHDERFIYHRDDFVYSTNHVEFNWLDDIMNKFMDYNASSLLRRICVSEEDRNRTTDPFIHYYTRSRLKTVISAVIAFLSTFLLLTPVYVLITVPMDMRMMATVVLGFNLLFAVSLSIFTAAKRFDIFIATATYSAVLVVFLSNFQQVLYNTAQD